MLLEIGDGVRYRGIGAGRVINHVERKFRGEDRLFAVIYFPHRDMSAQVPIGDPAMAKKLEKVTPERPLRKMLTSLSEVGDALPRTWDQREEMGENVIKNGEPEQWANLLRSYATAASVGVSVVASDAEIVAQAQELLAAELACSGDLRYEDAFSTVLKAYEKGAAPRKGISAEHYAAVNQLK